MADIIEVYTDGACLGNPGPGGWGAVVIQGGKQIEFSGGELKTTNNRMEISGVIMGLEQTPLGSSVKVTSDSEYVIKTMTRGWQRKVNTDLWDRLDELVGSRKVTWEWVRGHSGHPYNELADLLSTTAAKDVAYTKKESPVIRAIATKAEKAQAAKSARRDEAGSARVPSSLTHVDASGKARMVDVGEKEVTERVATARGEVIMQQATLQRMRDNAFEKGDVLGIARIAGVMAAKKTHELIPLCHPIPLTQVTVELDPHSRDDRVLIAATARATWKTGVEMEAMTAVTAAALTVYDMCKAIDRGMRIEAVRLVSKTGGKSGDYAGQ